MTLAVALLLCLAIAVPHGLRLDRAAPATAATIWGAALALRALVAVGVALFVVVWLPATELFQIVTHWCWHRVLPFLALHLGLNGHSIGDAATVLPATLLAASLVSVLFGLWRATRRVRLMLRRGTLGPGPRESVVISDGEVLVAAAGLRRPRVVISAGALVALDDEELDASLDHEHGHIARRHRYVLVGAELCRAVGRFLPGTARAAAEVAFHLERDADDYALRRRHHPAALASAICKACVPGPFAVAPVTALAGQGSTVRRVEQLLDGESTHTPGRGLRLLAAGMVALVLATAAVMPLAVRVGPAAASSLTAHHCQG
jgi:Zn-dependent protease with chaperone function